MSITLGFGEYETLLPCGGVNAALTFSRELFSREFVVQRVTSDALAAAMSRSETQWRGLARVNAGHAVVSVDGVAARGLSTRQFAELWYPPADQKEEREGSASRRRRVRFRDRKRAELEVEMQKAWAGSGPMRFAAVHDDVELQKKLREAHAMIWEHELAQAHALLRSLPVGGDPAVCVLAAELEVVRVLVSKDALYAKQAQRAANQAVTWLETVLELSSLSYSTRKQTQLALAEALFLSSLLRLGGDERLAAITTARRCAAIYVALEDKLFSNPNTSKRSRLLMPTSELEAFHKRIRFGLGVLHVGGALALQSALDWILTLLNGSCDIKRGIEYLLDCGKASEGTQCHLQGNWAALTLMYSSGALRLVRQRNERNIGDLLAREISVCQQSALHRHPKALLFLWSHANASNFIGDQMNHLEDELARISELEERAHIVRFDVGYRHFLAREFGRSSAHFMPICKCASAPTKLRGLSSLFIAANYLLTSHGSADIVIQDVKLLNSVRLLLRSSRRFLAHRLEEKPDDLEAGSLYDRLGAFLDSSDEYMLLLPYEVFYIYLHPTKMITIGSPLDLDLREHHLADLDKLNELSGTIPAEGIKLTHEPEFCLLRVIINFHLRELDECEKELQKMWSELHPQGNRPITNSSLSRLLSQRAPPPPPAFVAPIAWFYQLRLLLERRCSRSERASVEATTDSMPTPNYNKMVLPQDHSVVDAVQRSPYPYHHIYSSKLQALSKLVTRLANFKINDNSTI
ncbi:unnamed protein product [Phytophthora fragariaefolia]|uniref:Unnamed protein product n=1 Tax=Phytophthora fragariaefolia TaxID=1490495 RepID=A0A9W6YQ26_9STRA|nr:unnamed protein product [Phytophthora fragariaefolia]